jgi:hypothetical protein
MPPFDLAALAGLFETNIERFRRDGFPNRGTPSVEAADRGVALELSQTLRWSFRQGCLPR